MVIRDLMEAATAAMIDKTPKELTSKEIARMAGVTEGMIHYYFGGKDGLFVEIWNNFIGSAPVDSDDPPISRECVSERSITPLIKELTAFYYSRPQVVRASTIEFMRKESKLRAVFFKRHLNQRPMLVLHTLKLLIQRGIYRQDAEAGYATIAIMSIVLGPILFPYLMPFVHLGFDDLRDDSWADFIGGLIDGRYLVEQSACADDRLPSATRAPADR